MDFAKLKEKAIKFKNDTIDKAAQKLAESSIVIKKQDDLEEFIAKSKNTSFTDEKTWETKEFTKHSIVIFVKKDSDFYKQSLIDVPVLLTKAFASNLNLKICDIDLKELKDFNIKETPALVLFTNEKLEKIINWEEKIKKVVKTLDLDIIKAIKDID